MKDLNYLDYSAVVRELLNSPEGGGILFGQFNPEETTMEFMSGVYHVMKILSDSISEEQGDRFSWIFQTNLQKSLDKANNL